MGDMHGAIFCDPNFVDNFFTVDSTKLQTVLDSCKEKLDAFYFEEDITREGQLYNPICEVLNIIKQTVGSLPDSDTLSPFVDVSAESIPSDRSNTAEVKPDLALFEGSIRHWETMRMPIEIKRQATYLKTGMKKLTWYARMIFAHQMHRRHVYGLAICKWDATFVRFDRCGVLYSKPIDMRSQEFRKAFAGLMMLDEVAFGYDTAFTTKIGQDGRLEYYVDLPAEAFASEGDSDVPEGSPTDITGPTDAPNPPQIQTRRLKVVERLCHREGIRGRATVVVRLRKVIRPGHPDKPKEARQIKKRTRAAQEQQSTGEILGTRDYVLKMMWRDPEQKVEGEALQRLVGIYGIGQHMWHIDVLKPCSPLRCKSTAVEPCEGCLDMTASRDQVLVTTNMTDLDIEIPEEKEGEGTEYSKSDKPRLDC
ncbi:hypothetical protein FRC08_012418 [Ceratobasidium sp. 394]|nr:hypothetical protein FRC08_012418 [Ceratobasidium sp. 394]